LGHTERTGQQSTSPKTSKDETVIILAIDPGITGALAFLDTDMPNRVAVYDMPVLDGDINPHALYDHIHTFKPDHAVIERASSRPKQGIASAWRFSAAYTTACVVVRMVGIPLTIITPSSWKKAMKLPGGKDGKEPARALAIDMFPLSAQHFSRKMDHGRAEAALLAYHYSQWAIVK